MVWAVGLGGYGEAQGPAVQGGSSVLVTGSRVGQERGSQSRSSWGVTRGIQVATSGN